ncbi:MAG: M20/M25/M40 family metallo-hydrolase [Gemmataceae bacterium]|nr:M20/M25/M40 family metallo-hydrolase [Gemmataceae bacterium]MDW8264792.1 M20/M25/M40 family metallo-hydrolase [Gemmataceae bacterium]
MTLTPPLAEVLRRAVQPQRLIDTAVKLIQVPSPTGQAGAVADRLAELLHADGFAVERPTGGHATAPAVVARFATGRPGRTLQFDGHLDTVHLPFVPPRVVEGRITGSGSSDMKAGIAAAIEALRALRDTNTLPGGAILLTCHDLHEAPWGDGRQLDQLIRDGIVGDAVLVPEYLNHCIPIIGRGSLTWKATIRRPGPPIHEVMRPDEPNVIAAGAELVRRLFQLHERLAARRDPLAGSDSLFIGQIHSGEIFNQYPQECWLEGTRRWLPGTAPAAVEQELRDLFADLARDTGTSVAADLMVVRDAFQLDPHDPLVPAFQEAHALVSGRPLPLGAKMFCDDGNSFWSLARIATITHGPTAGGAHTVHEWVSIDDLVRVAQVYALTAVAYCA